MTTSVTTIAAFTLCSAVGVWAGGGTVVETLKNKSGEPEVKRAETIAVTGRSKSSAPTQLRTQDGSRFDAALSVRTAFDNWAKQWSNREHTNADRIEVITSLPAYRAIIRLGKEVVPLILGELVKRPDYWFAALRELTGENPVPPTARGKVPLMAQAWIEWGQKKNLLT